MSVSRGQLWVVTCDVVKPDGDVGSSDRPLPLDQTLIFGMIFVPRRSKQPLGPSKP